MRFFLAIALFCSSPALAQENTDDRARALFEEGRRLYDQGLYEEAVEAFKIAHALSERPLLLFNMASALERLGRFDEAHDALVTYRETAPEDEWKNLDSRIQQLADRIDATEPEPEPQPEPATTPQPAAGQRSGPPAAAWVLFGTGAAGIGVGSVFTGQALGARSEWSDACIDGQSGLLCPDSVSGTVKRDNTNSAIADVGWGVGALGIGGGVLVVALGGGGKASDLVFSAGPRGLRLGGRW